MLLLICHLLGDYVLQSDWMAREKTQRSEVALVHAVIYSLPFLWIARASWPGFAFIAGTHFLIDRFRLARYVCYAKNFFFSPFGECFQVNELGIGETAALGEDARVNVNDRYGWNNCSRTGYPSDVPAWLAFWLLIICDNTMHLICNFVALRWL